MALHTKLPIYRSGVALVALALKVQEQFPRSMKRSLGDRIVDHCTAMIDLMAMANATQREARAGHLDRLLARQRAVEALMRVALDSRILAPKLWAESIEVLGNIGAQAGGWLKTTNRAPVV